MTLQEGSSNLDVMLEIELPVTLRFGSTQMVLDEVLRLEIVSAPIERSHNAVVVASREPALPVVNDVPQHKGDILEKRDRVAQVRCRLH